jgi:glutathione S-transferase
MSSVDAHPINLRLHQFAPLADQESGSPFCVKVQYALRIKRLPFTVVNVSSPEKVRNLNSRGKLPVLEYDGVAIADSTEIIRYLEAHHPEPRLYPIEPGRRVHALMIEDWADESLYWHVVYERWIVREQFNQIAPALFAPVPAAMRPLVRVMVRRRVARVIQAQGLGHFTVHEHREKLRQSLDWLDAIVNGRFLVSADLSVADIAVAAQLAALMIPQTPVVAAEVRKRSNLMGWLEGVRAAVR